MLNTYTYKKMQVHFEINGANIADVADVTDAAWKFLQKWRRFENCINRMKVLFADWLMKLLRFWINQLWLDN